MKYCLPLVLLLVALAPPAQAQIRRAEPHVPADAAPASKAAEVPRVIHVTDLNSPETQANLRAYHEAKAAGLLPAVSKAQASPSLGTVQSFWVLQNINLSQDRVQRSFELKRTNDLADIWVQQTDLPVDQGGNGNVTEAELDALEDLLIYETPAGSFQPERGIIANDNAVFGQPPDVDGNGKITVLLYDIEEGNSDCCTLGFVYSVDVNPNAQRSNKADVLYLDAKEGTSSFSDLAAIAAHEYTHLIHYNYVTPSQLPTFMAEGLAEYAIVINGVENQFGSMWRSIDYLNKPERHNIHLLGWQELTFEHVLDSYERSGLFTTYIGDRIGVMETGRITREPPGAFGARAYQTVLDDHGLSLNEIVADFHTANFLNDGTVEARFGYQQYRRGLRALPTRLTNGTGGGATNFSEQLNAGGVHYATWTDVADFSVSVVASETGAANHANVAAWVRARVLLEGWDGSVTVEDFDLDGGLQTFAGAFERATLLLTHTELDVTQTASIDVAVSWNAEPAGEVQRTTLVYDTGSVARNAQGQGEYWSLGVDAFQASRFEVPEGSRLTAVQIAPIYESNFTDANGNPILPPSSPRDYTLYVWADDGAGYPGEELFALALTDGNPANVNFSTGAYSFIHINLEDVPNREVLGSLPPVVYVGLGNAGTDPNYLGMALSPYPEGNVSFLKLPNFSGWAAFDEVYIEEGGQEVYLLENLVLPIRTTFTILPDGTAAEEEGALPEAVTLAPNYPNPFNPTTTLAFALPHAAEVQLNVYDALGRHVATVADGFYAAGAHTARLDASGWPSGAYFSVLEAGGERRMRQIVLVK